MLNATMRAAAQSVPLVTEARASDRANSLCRNFFTTPEHLSRRSSERRNQRHCALRGQKTARTETVPEYYMIDEEDGLVEWRRPPALCEPAPQVWVQPHTLAQVVEFRCVPVLDFLVPLMVLGCKTRSCNVWWFRQWPRTSTCPRLLVRTFLWRWFKGHCIVERCVSDSGYRGWGWTASVRWAGGVSTRGAGLPGLMMGCDTVRERESKLNAPSFPDEWPWCRSEILDGFQLSSMDKLHVARQGLGGRSMPSVAELTQCSARWRLVVAEGRGGQLSMKRLLLWALQAWRGCGNHGGAGLQQEVRY